MRRVRSRRKRQILRALFDTLRPRGTEVDALVDTDSLLAAFEDFFRHTDPGLQAVFPLLLECFECGTFLFAGRLRPFTKLSLREREAYLRSWQESSLPLRRNLYRAINAFFRLIYYSRPSVMKTMNYQHQEYAEELRALRLERFGDEIKAREAKIRGETGEAQTLRFSSPELQVKAGQ